MNELIKKLASVYSGTSYQGKLWLVGGAVRDELLGLSAGDPDIMVEGDACEAAELLCRWGGDNPVYLPKYNSAKVTVCGELVEITGGRSDSYTYGSRKPAVKNADLTEDSFRRDLTINALYKNISTGEIIDPTGMGLKDIHDRILRTPIDPLVSFRQDPLRILRTVRFACLPGFSIASDVSEAIRNTAEELRILSGERIREELMKLLGTLNPEQGLRLMMEFGIFEVTIPELCPLRGLEQGEHHIYDAWEHTVRTVCAVGSSRIRLAALLHDISKPMLKSVDETGRISFPCHAQASADMAENIFGRLRVPKNEAKCLCNIIREHSTLFKCDTDKEFREAIHRNREVLTDLMELVRGDKMAAHPVTGPERLAVMQRKYDRLFEARLLEKELSPLSGEDIEAIMNIKGREVGRMKKYLCDKVLEGTLAYGDKKAAIELLKGKK